MLATVGGKSAIQRTRMEKYEQDWLQKYIVVAW